MNAEGLGEVGQAGYYIQYSSEHMDYKNINAGQTFSPKSTFPLVKREMVLYNTRKRIPAHRAPSVPPVNPLRSPSEGQPAPEPLSPACTGGPSFADALDSSSLL